MAEHDVDVADLLHRHDQRLTGPRRAVVEVLAAQGGGHLSTEQIVELVALRDEGVHRASVYRTLEALSQAGIVQHIHLGHGATAYHLIHGNEPHLHAQCRQCGAVVDLPDGLLTEVTGRLASELGFELDPTHVALSGVCRACAATGGIKR